MLSLSLCFGLTACGADNTESQDAEQTTEEAAAEQEEVEETLDPEDAAEMIPVLAYHKIKPYDKNDEATTLEMFDTTFKEQMDYLKKKGFTTLTLDEFYQWYTGEIEVPKKSVVITLDDGYYGTYYYAYPIIKENGQAATVFTIGHLINEKTDELDPDATQDHYVGYDVIEEARSEYPKYTYESHTFNMHKKIDGKHPVDVFSKDEMVEDIKSNEKYGFTYLAYPWGDYNKKMKAALEENGYKMAFAYRPFVYATRNDDKYAINRIRISGKCSMRDFKKIVNLKSKDHMPGQDDD